MMNDRFIDVPVPLREKRPLRILFGLIDRYLLMVSHASELAYHCWPVTAAR